MEGWDTSESTKGWLNSLKTIALIVPPRVPEATPELPKIEMPLAIDGHYSPTRHWIRMTDGRPQGHTTI
jgi:hypothetical protein